MFFTDLTDAELGRLNRAFYNALNVNPQATMSALIDIDYT